MISIRDGAVLVATGVWRVNYDWGYDLIGSRDALIEYGIPVVLLPDGTVRNRLGKIIRSAYAILEGQRVQTNVPKRGRALARFINSNSDGFESTLPMTSVYDGNTPAKWSDCDWQPKLDPT